MPVTLRKRSAKTERELPIPLGHRPVPARVTVERGDHAAEARIAQRRDPAVCIPQPHSTQAFTIEAETTSASRARKLCEDIMDGLENARAAFMGLLDGRNFGKVVVRVAD